VVDQQRKTRRSEHVHFCYFVEFMEAKECYLFSWGEMDGREDVDPDGKRDAEMEKFTQGSRGTPAGGDCGRSGKKSRTTASHQLVKSGVVVGCSSDSAWWGTGRPIHQLVA
jgi:hypothetical protein